MILAAFIIVLLLPLVRWTRSKALRRSFTYFVLGLIAFAVATQKFGGHLAMGAVLIGLPLYGAAAASTIGLTQIKGATSFYRLLFIAGVSTLVLFWSHFMLVTAQCIGVLYDCRANMWPLRFYLLLSFIFLVLGHWYSWGKDEAWVFSPLKIRKRFSRLNRVERTILQLLRLQKEYRQARDHYIHRLRTKRLNH